MPITAFLASTAATVLHEPETQRSLIDTLMHANVFNMLIVLAVLLFAASKAGLLGKVQEAHEKQVNDIKDTEVVAEKAKASKAKLTAAIDKLPEEEQQLQREAMEKLTWLKQQLLTKEATEQERLETLLNRQLDQMDNRIKAVVLSQYGDSVMIDVQSRIQSQLNEQQHEQLIAQAIQQVGASSGGRHE